jgi:P27 family predicted phage terminase small subunit
MTKPTAPPKHLSAESKKLWRSVLADYELEPRHEAVLLAALEALDRMRQAQALIAAEGLTVLDRYGTAKAHPAVVIERDSRTAFLRAMRELGLDLDAPPTTRPPSRYHQ